VVCINPIDMQQRLLGMYEKPVHILFRDSFFFSKDLKSLMSFHNTGVEGLNYPLMGKIFSSSFISLLSPGF